MDISDLMWGSLGDGDGAPGAFGESEAVPSLTRAGVEGISEDASAVLCGLDSVNHLDPAAVAETRGMIIRVGDAVFDLGDPGEMAGSVTLADDRGLSIFADRDGDGAADHVTTMLYDGTWEMWSGDAPLADPGGADETAYPESGGDSHTEVAAWERIETGRWG